MFEQGPPSKRELEQHIVLTEDFLHLMPGFLRNNPPGSVELTRKTFEEILDFVRLGRALAIELMLQRIEHPLCERDAYDTRLTTEQRDDVSRYLLGNIREALSKDDRMTAAQRKWVESQLDLLESCEHSG